MILSCGGLGGSEVGPPVDAGPPGVRGQLIHPRVTVVSHDVAGGVGVVCPRGSRLARSAKVGAYTKLGA